MNEKVSPEPSGGAPPRGPKRMREAWINGLLLLATLCVGLILTDWISTFFLDSRSPFERVFPVEQTRHPQPFIMFKGKPGGAENLRPRPDREVTASSSWEAPRPMTASPPSRSSSKGNSTRRVSGTWRSSTSAL